MSAFIASGHAKGYVFSVLGELLEGGQVGEVALHAVHLLPQPRVLLRQLTVLPLPLRHLLLLLGNLTETCLLRFNLIRY